MMIKYRVHEVAKDFDVQSKEIVNILKDFFEEPKKTQSPLEEKELDIVFEVLTQTNQVESFDTYCAKGEAARLERKAAAEKAKADREAEQARIAAELRAAAAAAAAAAAKPAAPKAESKPDANAEAPKADKAPAKKAVKKAPAKQPKVIQFNAGSYEASTATPKAPHTHRCTICGRTDVSHPDLEFRYCSRCNGYHCYCQDHISNHTHIES